MFMEDYKKLVNAILNNPEETEPQELVDFLNTRVDKMPNYIRSVVNMQVQTESARAMMQSGRIDIGEYQYRVQKYDSDRKSAHDAALAALDQINRLCKANGIESICPENPDRHVRANFMAAVTMECFMVDHQQSREEIQQMYDLVKAGEQTEKNVDRVVALSQSSKIKDGGMEI